MILNTHGHSDHIAGNRALKERWPDCPLIIGHGDVPKLADAELNLSARYGRAAVSRARPPTGRFEPGIGFRPPGERSRSSGGNHGAAGGRRRDSGRECRQGPDGKREGDEVPER